jgi:hypothetical protein
VKSLNKNVPSMTAGNTTVHMAVAVCLCKMFSHHNREFSAVTGWQNLSFP